MVGRHHRAGAQWARHLIRMIFIKVWLSYLGFCRFKLRVFVCSCRGSTHVADHLHGDAGVNGSVWELWTVEGVCCCANGAAIEGV